MRLTCALYGNFRATKQLERLNWVRISADGRLMCSWDIPLTQPQIDALYDLVTVSDGEYRDNLLRGLKNRLEMQS